MSGVKLGGREFDLTNYCLFRSVVWPSCYALTTVVRVSHGVSVCCVWSWCGLVLVWSEHTALTFETADVRHVRELSAAVRGQSVLTEDIL